MRSFPPAFDDRHDLAPVVVRCDYSDDDAFTAVVHALTRPFFIIRGPEWDGATVGEVMAVARCHPAVPVVFIADTRTMSSPEHPLLAVANTTPDDDDYAETTRAGRAFRVRPSAAHEVHGLLELLVAGFAGLAEQAAREPDQVYRGLR
ncbi:hypothetical protein OWR29_01755 [Actinoplanes sp. Pm04-4]|uniref:DUF6924 domain-containing protein n=1 Tax=Paractinoplanes pyxinae TaxID=2997416 RepID=A0ABT4ASL3_9ACTN|nr:hypothetical protein [Actinoplanes pyxinae]MCY1136705.1 hypothetical protein [Actinoplanes pyxinae]